ncbi:MAG TPA: hypothetical protein VLE49_15145 [Anaerolineales bacterium]|nr:hypothetical protein [Anaerolineales bacterium]
MKKAFVLILSALLISSCLPQNIQVPQSPLLPLLERKSGLIGYVGIDGNVYISDQGGGNPAQLTQDAALPQGSGNPFLLYEYPTWSRDGSELAFVGVSSDGKQTQSKVMVVNVDNNSANEIYTSKSAVPIYLNWSPDNARLNFTSSDVSSQNVILQSVPSQGGTPTILDVGSPYYWSWAPDGRQMIVHAGGAGTSVPEHVAFLSVDSTTVTEQALDSSSASFGPLSSVAAQAFQAPAWSPDGSRIALARVSEKENQIIVTDTAGKNPKKIGTFTSKAAFAWSSDGTRIAYLDGIRPMNPGIFGPLHVVDLETSKEISEDGNIIAFFWSPNGEKLAYFNLVKMQASGSSSGSSGDTQATTQLAVELYVLDVTSEKSQKLLTYIPTDLFLSILPYFDQYHQAVTIWSPDNNNLVLSLVDDTNGPSIAVIAATGNLQPRTLANGYLAFWSWK